MQLTNHEMQSNFIRNWNMRCNCLKWGKYARDRELTFLTGSRSFFLEWGCFLLFHLGGLVRIRGWWVWGQIFLFMPPLSILLIDRLLRIFSRLWFLHLDSLQMLLLFLFLIKEGLSRGKSKYFFPSSKVELDLPRSHIYASICSIKERMTKD